MDKRLLYLTIVVGIFSLLAAVTSSRRPYWYLLLVVSAVFLNIASSYIQSKRIETYTKMGEKLFLLNCGAEADKTEIILRPVSKYDKKIYRIPGKAVQMKFWSQKTVYKGILDTERGLLHMKEPVSLPVYQGESVLVWKETPAVHRNSMPKKVEFYDSTELLHRVDRCDEKGNLVKDSWRRHNGIVEYWNPKEQTWEPIP